MSPETLNSIAQHAAAPHTPMARVVEQRFILDSVLPPAAAGDDLRIWGMTARQLHDAYWLSRGVQCVRLGEGVSIDTSSDMHYLLVRNEQLVLFDLRSVLARLIWHVPSVTSLQLADGEAHYREKTILDGEGYVRRIERVYTPDTCFNNRAHLTATPAVARLWRDRDSVRQWRRGLRSAFPRPHMDRLPCAGLCTCVDDVDAQRAFLTKLIEHWPDPHRSISGVRHIGGGVMLSDHAPPPDATVIGPVWIGRQGTRARKRDCIIGPTFLADSSAEDGQIDHHHHPQQLLNHTADSRTHESGAAGGRGYLSCKRVFDVAVSGVLLALLWPLMLFIALCIAIDDGYPVLFRHRRQTRGGRLFSCLKFRTMQTNAETLVPDLARRNVCDGPQVYIENDPRVTRVGRLLRMLHLDELPQLWNVLVGDMSIVGPRPSPDKENRYCPAWREMRLSVRPGMTGLWQLKRTRKPGHDFQEWIRYDMEYVKRASLWLDIAICVQTAVMLLRGRSEKP